MKKLVALVLALVMVLSVSATLTAPLYVRQC